MTGQPARSAALKEHLAGFGSVPDDILSTSPGCKASLEMARISSDHANFGEISVDAGAPGFLVSVQLGDLHARRVYKGDGVEMHVYGRDSISIHYLDEAYKADLLTPFDFALCYVSREAISAIAQEVGAGEVTSLTCLPVTRDPVAADLCRALLPTLHRRPESESIFVDAAAMALLSHLTTTYGDAGTSGPRKNGGLADWQKRRAIELLAAAAEARGAVSVSWIASECRLSRSYFVRAFKRSTGLPPHRWMADFRLRKARQLLSETDEPIAEVADKCGFADQAHLTRAFASATGLTPAAWRRHIRC
ncbi:helix-turn-helix domain-containing protein [Ancylobacter radicis]|uniref:Helix-turn-helix transcriptional regulator n=1 Tax=Ancylobacter radicis TaxID=2836179 RepID=A0ABS5R8Q3_9HYPH|nr:AraC family transcriptional regulator [Ancylobacter radicis]MBS9478050.1 helix-turn-helix transcriptional regulator [Ancylobacter radicis]